MELHIILSTVCIAAANICIGWFVTGFLFHSTQQLTPNTWRAESNRSYMYSMLVSLLFGAVFTLFYRKIGADYVINGSLWSHIKLGLICFGCFGLTFELGNAIYVNVDRKFVLGRLIDSCFSIVAAAIIAGLFFGK